MANPLDGEAIEDLGRYIKVQREIARLSVRHLARIAQVSDSYLSQIEKGRYQPSAQVLTNLAQGLNLQPDVLFRMAGWLPAPCGDTVPGVEEAIRRDNRLTESQRTALAQLYRSMVDG